MSIDDPIKAVQRQYPEHDSPLALAMQILGPLAPFTGVAAALGQFFSGKGTRARIRAMFEAFEFYIRNHGKRLDELESRINSPKFIDALVTAIEESARAAQPEKVERFGRVLGHSLAADPKTSALEEAPAYIRQLSELGQADIDVLKILYDTQGHLLVESQRTFEAFQFESTMQTVFARLNEAHIHRDDFYARCARLQGFGLALWVAFGTALAGPNEYTFRLTLRGKSLVEILTK